MGSFALFIVSLDFVPRNPHSDGLTLPLPIQTISRVLVGAYSQAP